MLSEYFSYIIEKEVGVSRILNLWSNIIRMLLIYRKGGLTSTYQGLKVSCLVTSYSLALEKLRVHLKTKEKLSERKKRKFEAMQRKYLQGIQQKTDGDGLSEKEIVQNYLNQRREVTMEIDTRYLEVERRRAEEDLVKVYLLFLQQLC